MSSTNGDDVTVPVCSICNELFTSHISWRDASQSLCEEWIRRQTNIQNSSGGGGSGSTNSNNSNLHVGITLCSHDPVKHLMCLTPCAIDFLVNLQPSLLPPSCPLCRSPLTPAAQLCRENALLTTKLRNAERSSRRGCAQVLVDIDNTFESLQRRLTQSDSTAASSSSPSSSASSSASAGWIVRPMAIDETQQARLSPTNHHHHHHQSSSHTVRVTTDIVARSPSPRSSLSPPPHFQSSIGSTGSNNNLNSSITWERQDDRRPLVATYRIDGPWPRFLPDADVAQLCEQLLGLSLRRQPPLFSSSSSSLSSSSSSFSSMQSREAMFLARRDTLKDRVRYALRWLPTYELLLLTGDDGGGEERGQSRPLEQDDDF